MFTVHQFCEAMRDLLDGRKLTPIAKKAHVSQGLLWRLITQKVDSDMGIVKAGNILEAAGYEFDEMIYYLLTKNQSSQQGEHVEIRLPSEHWEQIRSHPEFQHIATTPVRYLSKNE